MEHRCHVLEQSGYTADLGHNLFTGSWFYDYPICSSDKNQYNTRNFAENLLAALEKAHIGEVDLITDSYGGLIGTYATKSPLIHEVVAIHPPVFGSPLADKSLMEYAIKYLEFEQKLIAKIVNSIINYSYGFEIENSQGLLNPVLQEVADLRKLIVVGSSINYETEKNILIKKLYKLIEMLTSKENDAIVLFERQDLIHFGIPFYEEDDHLSHFAAGSKENILKVKKKVLDR